MRPAFVLVLLGVLLSGCDPNPQPKPSTPPAPAPAPTPDLSKPPSLAEIDGWWLVAADAPASDDPGGKQGSAYWFTKDVMRLLFGDSSDRRNITANVIVGPALKLTLEGTTIEVTRRAGGISVKLDADDARIPLRRATETEVRDLEKRVARLAAMVERACTKAIACCNAAKAKNLGNDEDCKALLGPPEITRCIRSIAMFKNKAKAGGIELPECLPDK